MKSERPVAIVTGASHGIGAGLVEGYRERGYGVVATSRKIGTSGDDQVLAIAGDIRERSTAQHLVSAAKERFGRVDTLVNNAGLFIGKPFLEYTPQDFDEMTATNLTGLFHVMQVVLEELLSQGHGHIVNISASVADQPLASAPSGLASMTKGGVSAVTKSLAIEFARRGVRVNAVAPGITRTPMHPPATYEGLANLVPEGRLGEVKDVVEAVLYLESAPFVTGEILHVDGGTAAGVP